MFIKKTTSISMDELMEQNELEQPTKSVELENSPYVTKKVEKYFLPVLHLNREEAWEPKPMKERSYFTDEVAMKTCLSNCCGYEGLKSACCTLDPDDLEHILGPIDERWIKKTLLYFKRKGMSLEREDIVIDYEEGKLIGQTHFNGHKIFEQKTSYPMLRIQVYGPRWGCKFLNPKTGMCTIYHIRPDMCRNYLCQYVKTNFLVRTRQKPNTYQNIRKTDPKRNRDEK